MLYKDYEKEKKVRCNYTMCEHNDQSNGCMLGEGHRVNISGKISGDRLVVIECSEKTIKMVENYHESASEAENRIIKVEQEDDGEIE